MPEQISPEGQIGGESERKNNLSLKIIALLVIAALAVLGVFAVKNKTEPEKGTATLSWAANSESDLAGYKIYYGTSSRNDSCPEGGYSDKTDVGKTETPEAPKYTLGDLEGGVTYYFSVTSFDAAGNESCFSPEMSKAIAAAPASWYQSLAKIFSKK